MPTTELQINAETVEQQTRSHATDKITVNAAFSGVGAPNATVRFTIDGKAKRMTARTDSEGVWTFTPTGLADGQHTIVVSETDTTGSHVTASLTFSLATEPAMTRRPGLEEPARQASSDARDKADHLIKMFLDEIKRSNKLTQGINLELRRELRQQYGKKIALEMSLFQGAEEILDKYVVQPLEEDWIVCRARRHNAIKRPDTELTLLRLFCVRNSANVTEHDVHDIVTMITTQCDPTVALRDSQRKSDPERP